MSGPRITDAAVEAAIASCWPSNSPTPSWLKQRVTAELAAALPHIRRAVIEELVEKAEDGLSLADRDAVVRPAPRRAGRGATVAELTKAPARSPRRPRRPARAQWARSNGPWGLGPDASGRHGGRMLTRLKHLGLVVDYDYGGGSTWTITALGLKEAPR